MFLFSTNMAISETTVNTCLSRRQDIDGLLILAVCSDNGPVI